MDEHNNKRTTAEAALKFTVKKIKLNMYINEKTHCMHVKLYIYGSARLRRAWNIKTKKKNKKQEV